MTFILLAWKFSFHEKTSNVIKGVEIMKVYPSVMCVLAGHPVSIKAQGNVLLSNHVYYVFQ